MVAGAVHSATTQVNARTAEYLGFLTKGQIPPASISLTAFEDTFVLENKKYAVRVRPEQRRFFSSALMYWRCLS